MSNAQLEDESRIRALLVLLGLVVWSLTWAVTGNGRMDVGVTVREAGITLAYPHRWVVGDENSMKVSRTSTCRYVFSADGDGGQVAVRMCEATMPKRTPVELLSRALDDIRQGAGRQFRTAHVSAVAVSGLDSARLDVRLAAPNLLPGVTHDNSFGFRLSEVVIRAGKRFVVVRATANDDETGNDVVDHIIESVRAT